MLGHKSATITLDLDVVAVAMDAARANRSRPGTGVHQTGTPREVVEWEPADDKTSHDWKRSSCRDEFVWFAVQARCSS
jgi:hypothetical protein